MPNILSPFKNVIEYSTLNKYNWTSRETERVCSQHRQTCGAFKMDTTHSLVGFKVAA